MQTLRCLEDGDPRVETIRVEEEWHENVSVYRARGCLEVKVER